MRDQLGGEERAQQEVINGIKDRLTDPLRLPYNFIKGPIIGWNAPKAFVSDMGFLTMPQLVLAAGIGGSSPAEILCGTEPTECGPGPEEGSIEVPESVRQKAVDKLLKDSPQAFARVNAARAEREAHLLRAGRDGALSGSAAGNCPRSISTPSASPTGSSSPSSWSWN